MNALFASAALGLVAAWPASGLGWLLGKAADKLTGDPAPRADAWNRALALPPAVLALMIGVSALPEEAAAPVYQIVGGAKAVGAVGAAANEASARLLSGFNGVETAGALLILGALGGLAVAATQQVTGRLRLKHIIRDARPAPQDLSLAVRAAARRLDTGRPEVRISDKIDQPMLAGLTTPVILLPAALAESLNIDRLVPICAHELAHLKRGDNWRLLFEHLLGGLFWMAPPYALLRARAAATREELCDALALDGAAPDIRHGYAQNLIAVLRARAAPALHPAFTGKGRKPTAMRLQAITDPRRPAGLARKVLLGVVTALAVTAAGAASIALAQQGDGKSGHSTTRISSSDPRQNFTIDSNVIRVTNAELDNGRLKVPTGQKATYLGDVTVRGVLSDGAIVLLNGKTPPAGFDLTKLPKGAIQALEVTDWRNGRYEFNAVMP